MYELPVAAVRETIANAVLHRSYLDKTCVQVSLYDDRMEVSSQGMLYGGMDIETAKKGKSTCRNEVIAEAFHYMHIAEAWGTGLPRIINRCEDYSKSICVLAGKYSIWTNGCNGMAWMFEI